MSDLFKSDASEEATAKKDSVDEDIVNLVESCIEQIEARELDLTTTYDNWFRIGLAFAYTFREDGLDYFHRVSRFHDEYDPQKCDEKYSELLLATSESVDDPITIKTFFEFCRRADVKMLPRSGGKIAKKFQKVMRYLDAKNIKFNEFTRKTEIHGEELNDRHISSIYADLQEAGVPASKDYINTLMLSNRTQDYHPIRDFLNQSVRGGFGNEIDQLLQSLEYATVIENEVDLLDNLIIKWLLQIPAVVYDEIPPRLVLVFIGKSHIGKTYFFRHLMPPELSAYYAESDLSRGKDSMILMSEKLLINNDEFGGIMKMNEMEHFKRIASAESFDERRAYGRFNEKFRRRAVLSGTSNRYEVIMDHTAGNTRIIPIEIEGIDHALFNAIDKTRLMAEVVALYRDRGKDSVKLNAADRQSLEEFSKKYEAVNFEHEAILSVCRHGQRFYPTIDIANAIRNQVGITINPKKLAQALKMLEFEPDRKRINGVHRRGWKMDLFGPASRFDDSDDD